MVRQSKGKGRNPSKDETGLPVVNSENAIEFLIGIKAPDWKIKEIRQGIVEGDEVSHFHLEYIGEVPVCPDCGQTMKKHDEKDRIWRHANLDKTVCFLHAPVIRYRCPDCGTTIQADIPWADPKVSYTRRFEQVAIEHLAETSLSGTSRILMCSWSVLDGIVDNVVNKYLDKLDLSKVTKIRVDETSAKKRHRYITVITDAVTDRIIFISKGKDSKTIGEFANWLIDHGGNPLRIEVVSSDLGTAFVKGTREYLPNAESVYDPFHVIQLGNIKLDKDRARNQENGERQKSIRYALLKNEVNLKDDEKVIVQSIVEENKELGTSYAMNMALRKAMSYRGSAAKEYLTEWIKWVEEKGSMNFRSLAKTVKSHLDGIIRALELGINNGFQEGLNGMVQLTKAIARGFHKEEKLSRMVWFRDCVRALNGDALKGYMNCLRG